MPVSPAIRIRPIPALAAGRYCGITLAAALVLALLVPDDAGAIVTRHDRDEADYRALAARFPAAVDVKPDGVGTLIAPRFVLTAAHVAQGTLAREPKVVAAGVEHPVERVFLPPGWSGFGPHDIALFRLADPVVGIEPVPLWRGDDEAGRVVTFVGTGDTGNGLDGPVKMDGIRRAATNRIDACDDEWIFFTFQSDSNATDLEGVSGPGDSGGPAFLSVDGETFVAGVSSHSRNGDPGLYGTREVYARVSSYADWIDAIVSGESPDTGLAPGPAANARERTDARAPGDPAGDGEAVVVTRGGRGRPLSEVEGGDVVAAWLTTYNSADDDAMRSFIEERFSGAYRARKSVDELVAYHGRLRNDHVGGAESDGVVESSPGRVVLRVRGEKCHAADVRFRLDADGRIDDLSVAIIEITPR